MSPRWGSSPGGDRNWNEYRMCSLGTLSVSRCGVGLASRSETVAAQDLQMVAKRTDLSGLMQLRIFSMRWKGRLPIVPLD